MKRKILLTLVFAGLSLGLCAVEADGDQAECEQPECTQKVDAATQNDSAEHRQRAARTQAADSLSQTLPRTFINRGTIEDLYDKIEETLDPKTHTKLVRLQAEAELLYEQRKAMLMIEGVDKNHESVKALDTKIEALERQLDSLIYNGGALHWKTLLAVGLGAGTGLWAAKSEGGGIFAPVTWLTRSGGTSTGNRIWRGIAHGLIATVMIEYVLRGRRSVIGGNIFRLIKFICKAVVKAMTKLFGRAGWIDKLGSTLEKALRPLGKKLDKVLGGAAGPILVVGVTAVVVGLALHFTRRRA